MQDSSGENLALILGAWSAARSSGSSDRIAAILADDVIWEARSPEQEGCRGRQEVTGWLSRGLLQRRITGLDIRESGDDVIATAEGPDFVDIGPDGEITPRPSATMVFTIKGGLVVHMKGA